MTVKVGQREVEVVDFHVHPKVVPSGRLLGAEEIVAEMDRAGVDVAVLLAVETDPKGFKRLVSEEERLRACMEYYRLQGRRAAYWMDEGLMLYEFDQEVEWLLKLLNTPSEEVERIVSDRPGRLIGFASINPHQPPDAIREAIRSVRERGFKGLKLLPTIQFFNPRDSYMDPVYEAASREGLIVLMHTGCDPGPWEVVEFSRNANPLNVGDVAERYPELNLVMAHLGSYSAIKPGVWFNEAVEVLRRHDNVYADVAAIDERLIERALSLGVPEDRILYGSDYPVVSGWCDISTGMRNPIDAILRLDLSFEVKEKILGLNAKRLLGLSS